MAGRGEGKVGRERRQGAQWPWRPFVLLGLASALAPGFLYGALMGSAQLFRWDSGSWYAAVRQGHGHAMLMGWGGSMLLGVALHFLPRLRGAKMVAPNLVPWLFWAYLGGLGFRVFAPPLARTLASNATAATTALDWAIALAATLEASAVLGILIILAQTLRRGPELSKKKGFRQVLLPVATAGLAMVLSQLAWIWAATVAALHRESTAVLRVELDRAASETLLFGAVAALALGMSARLFPMTFRREHAWNAPLRISAVMLLAGVIATAAGIVDPFGWADVMSGIAAGAFGCGVILGGISIRIFERTPERLLEKSHYRLWRDPAGVGVASAFAWAMVAGALLLLFSGATFAGKAVVAGSVLKDLARHAMGAGFMTVLIVSVGWTMLPGFGGGQPLGRPWIWAAVGLTNLAAALRIAPGGLALAGQDAASRVAYAYCWSAAGVSGFLGILAFGFALKSSWRRSGQGEANG